MQDKPALYIAERFVNREELARHLGCCVRTVDDMKAKGEIPFTSIRKRIMFKISKVEAVLGTGPALKQQNAESSEND